MVDWKRLERQVDRAIGRAFGENIRIIFYRNSVVDPTRPALDTVGILHSPNADGTVQLGNGMVMSVATTQSALMLQRVDLPNLVVKAGDKVRATTDAGTFMFYDVTKVSDRFPSIWLLHLSAV